MARPTLEQAALRTIAEQADTAVEALDVVLCWLERESEIAANSFDKPRQGRLAVLSTASARVLQALYNIKNQTQ